MYPDWPESPGDLVPLPHCDGPKLKPFDFKGPQRIKFLDHVGQGLHAHVFKVEILGSVYALKLFRFVPALHWVCLGDDKDYDLEAMSAFYDYSEPFSAECRAFGRLQEANCEHLALQCYGYLLMNEENERELMNTFSDMTLDFNGAIDEEGFEDIRSGFLGQSGRPPPLRGILKAFGQSDEDIQNKSARLNLQEIIQIQQLGIINIDVAHRQLISGKFADFSVAITIPHFTTTPDLNPRLTPKSISALEFETFQFSINDYYMFDDMVLEWNYDHKEKKDGISVQAFPGGHSCQIKYNLRSTPRRELPFTFVDPRLYDWKNPFGTNNAKIGQTVRTVGGGRPRERVKGSACRKLRGAILKPRPRLQSKPPLWYYSSDMKLARLLTAAPGICTTLDWEYKDGLIFPQERDWFGEWRSHSMATSLKMPLPEGRE